MPPAASGHQFNCTLQVGSADKQASRYWFSHCLPQPTLNQVLMFAGPAAAANHTSIMRESCSSKAGGLMSREGPGTRLMHRLTQAGCISWLCTNQ